MNLSCRRLISYEASPHSRPGPNQPPGLIPTRLPSPSCPQGHITNSHMAQSRHRFARRTHCTALVIGPRFTRRAVLMRSDRTDGSLPLFYWPHSRPRFARRIHCAALFIGPRFTLRAVLVRSDRTDGPLFFALAGLASLAAFIARLCLLVLASRFAPFSCGVIAPTAVVFYFGFASLAGLAPLADSFLIASPQSLSSE
jgi:hypothetical protein